MADRNIGRTVILAKSEATYGIDPTPTGAANAMLVGNLSINPINLSTVDRSVMTPYLGASALLPGTRYVEMSFDVELVGSGVVATAPAYGPLLLACGFAGAATATIRYDYTLVSSAMGSITIYWFDDGLVHRAVGARGSVTFSVKVGEKPKMSFKFIGIYVSPMELGNPAATLTAFKVPQVVTRANTGDLTFAGTHATGVAPAIVLGTGMALPSQGLEIDIGNDVNFTPLSTQETVDISDRVVVGKVTLDLTAAQEAALISSVESGMLQTIGLQHGTVAAQKSLLWLPNAQLLNPQKVEVKRKRMVSFDLRGVPLNGNDEFRLVTSF